MSALIATEGLSELEEEVSCPGRRGPAAPAGSLRELLAVALPLALSSGSLALMNVIDRFFLTRYSTDALAAASPAGMLHWTAMSLVLGMASCVTAFVAQYDGAGRKSRAAASLWQGIYLSFAAGLIFLAVVPAAPAIFRWADHAPHVQTLEVEYFSVLCYGAIPMTLCSALSGFYSGRGRTWTVLGVNALLAATNTLLAWLLVFGAGPIPALGMRGAALATVIAYVVAVAAYFLLLTRREERSVYGVWANRRLDRELFGRLVRFGLPSGCQFFADIAAFTLFLFMIGRLGPVEQAATNLAFNLNGLAFVPLLGLGTAVMSLVGRRVGERRPELAVRTAWTAFALGGGWTLAFAVAYLLVPDLMLAPYESEAAAGAPDFVAIRRTTIELLHYVALYSFFDAMIVVFSNAVRGAGDTRFPMVFMLVTSWGVMLGPVWLATSLGRNSLAFSWWMCTVAVVFGGFGMMTRFALGRWKSLSMIETDPVSEEATEDPEHDRARVILAHDEQPEPVVEAAAAAAV